MCHVIFCTKVNNSITRLRTKFGYSSFFRTKVKNFRSFDKVGFVAVKTSSHLTQLLSSIERFCNAVRWTPPQDFCYAWTDRL